MIDILWTLMHCWFGVGACRWRTFVEHDELAVRCIMCNRRGGSLR